MEKFNSGVGDRELKVPIISRSRSTSSMFQAVSSSPRNEPKAKKQGQHLSYIPSCLHAGETTQHGQFSRFRSQSSPSAPLLHSSTCQQPEQSDIGSSNRVRARPLTMGDEVLPGAKRHLEINTRVLAQSGPAAPRDRLLPESPGFPKMLAAMTFPVPPTTSRPSTAGACVSSTTRYQSSITSFPQVRPRSSSKRATSSKGKPAASLDELIAQQTSLHRQCEPGETSHTPSTPEKLVINTSMTRNSRSATVGETGSSLAMGSLRPRASSAASSTLISDDPRSFTENDNGRQSFPFPDDAKLAPSSVRDLVSMDEPYNIPIGIAISSSRDIASDMNKSFAGQEGESLQQDTHAVPTISLTLPSPYEEKDYHKRALEQKAVQQGSDNNTLPNKPTPTPNNHVALDFDPTIVPPIPSTDDSKDSPILGRFVSSSPTTRRVRSRSSSRTRGGQVVCTKSGLAQTTQIGSVEKIQPALTILPGNSWKFSQVMTTEIIPEKQADELITAATLNSIAMTPVMVVANLTPRPEPRVPAPCPSPSSSLPPLRPHLNKIKSMSQQRQKPVPIKVHNNAIASHGDHTRLFTDKLNRHTLAGVPTPPTSPSSASPKRNSHPMEIIRRSQLRTAGKPYRRSEQTMHQPNQEKPNEEVWRITTAKVRLEKAKLAREEEISRLVERMLGVAKAKDRNDEELSDMQGGHAEEQIEKRLQRLEEDGDACLQDVKSVLQNMSRTLEELRKESGSKKLIVNEFRM
ncbi:uncharacterized protein F4812DRAFT_352977 [Daldinia caldariorum]|uniref:uncharacterized protein n=1 Tax=Daldinia caldariorum TaxID=326644 RepID=UPI002007EA6F|nr:uncharacterized protein F4812DRAFT_352977 [Daldinia caldariorum]KAI1468957.1 hypothetical protein F4812DRAFT_352977 [Daldinia caldariorum]